MKDSEDAWLKVSGVARAIGMSGTHVRLLIATGQLAASRDGERGNYRVRKAELDRYLAELEAPALADAA